METLLIYPHFSHYFSPTNSEALCPPAGSREREDNRLDERIARPPASAAPPDTPSAGCSREFGARDRRFASANCAGHRLGRRPRRRNAEIDRAEPNAR